MLVESLNEWGKRVEDDFYVASTNLSVVTV